MESLKLSDIKYNFIPTSFISSSAAIDCEIQRILRNVVGEEQTDKSDVFYTKLLCLSPFVHPMDAKDALKYIKNTSSRRRDSSIKCCWNNSISLSTFEDYTKTKATCFCVFGKPSAKTYKVAKYLAKNTGRFHVDAVQLVIKEVTNDTNLGAWIWFNLKKGRKIPIQIATHILLDELGKSKYARKGYVLSGLPIIPACELKEEFLPVPVEEVPQDFSYFQNKKGTQEEDSSEDDNDEFTILSEEGEPDEYYNRLTRLHPAQEGTYKLLSTEDSIDYSVRNQLQLISDLDMPPDVVFYLYSEDDQADMSLSKNDKKLLSRQLARYEQSFKDIQMFILKYEKKNVIRLDERVPEEQLFQHIKNRLEYVFYKRNYNAELVDSSLLPSELPENVPIYNLKERLQIMCQTNTVQSNLRWLKSDFNTYCPCELQKGRRVAGSIDFAVKYLGYVFFLASKSNAEKFMRSPELFVECVPNCRVAIIGQQKSGKTIARILKYLFGAAIFDVRSVVENLLDDDCQAKRSEVLQQSLMQAVNIAQARREYCKTTNKSEKEFETFDNDGSCAGEEQFVEPSSSDPLTKFIFEEEFYEECVKTLITNDRFIENFTDFLVKLNNDTRKKTNFNKMFGQWILDDAPLHLKFWKTLQEDQLLPDVVIFLVNNSEGNYEAIFKNENNPNLVTGQFIVDSINKSNLLKSESIKHMKELLNFIEESSFVDESISKYAKFMAERVVKKAEMLNQTFDELENFLLKQNITIIKEDIGKNNWNVVVEKVILKYLYLFKTSARRVEYDEMLRLSKPQEKPFDAATAERLDEEEENNFGVEEANEEEDIFENIRLGNVNQFCTVSYNENNILAKCRPRICAEYDNLIYPLCSETCYEKFMNNPELYTNRYSKPKVPQPMYWILGPTDAEHFSLMSLISKEFFIKPLVYNKRMQNFKPTSSNTWEKMQLPDLIDLSKLELTESIAENLRTNLKNGVVISGFPVTKRQFKYLIDHHLHPDLIFIMFDRYSFFKALLEQELEIWKSGNSSVTDYPTYELENEQFEDGSNDWDLFSELNEHFSETKSFRTSDDEFTEKIFRMCQNIVELISIQIEEMENLAKEINIPVLRVPKQLRRRTCLNVKWLQNVLGLGSDRIGMFGQVIEIPVATAEKCISTGLFRFSRFKYSCPVDVDDLMLLNRYAAFRDRQELKPCIFGQFIYFINGSQNFQKFKKNPFKYINPCAPLQNTVPLRVAVMGPKSSGVTTLCNRIAKEFGMQVFTTDDLKSLIKNNLVRSSKPEDLFIYRNYILPNGLSNCLLLLENSSPNGIILDNFPLSGSHILEAARCNVDFHLVLLNKSKLKNIWKNFHKSEPQVPVKNYLKQFVNLHASFKIFEDTVRELTTIKELSFFNVKTIDSGSCKWMTWNLVKPELNYVAQGIVGHEFLATRDKCTTLANLNLWQEEFSEYISELGPYCPVCATAKKLVKYCYNVQNMEGFDYRPDLRKELLLPFGYRSKEIASYFGPWDIHPQFNAVFSQFDLRPNIVQYKGFIYWCCNDHVVEVLFNSDSYLPVDLNHIPAYLPFLIDAASTYLFQIQQTGENPEHFIFYKNKAYLVSSEQVLDFLFEPEKNSAIIFKPPRVDELDSIEEDDNDIFDDRMQLAINDTLLEISKTRPKHHALSLERSVGTFLGLYLRFWRENQYAKRKFYYNKFMEFVGQCRAVENELKQCETDLNPYILWN